MAIIGAILGDIAGSKWEFNRPKDLDYEHIELFQDDSYYTDDTVLSVATKYALENEVSFKDAYNEFGNDYIDCGYGDRFFEWLIFKSKKPYKSCGNGSAMRVSPVIDFAKSRDDIIKYATMSAECTHNHQEGIKGAVVTAACGWMAKNGASKKEIEEYASREYPAGSYYKYPVSMSMKELREVYRWDETCQGSVPAAIRCFLDSEDYLADQLFIKYKVTVDFGDEYVKENSPYHVIFCKIRKRDEKKFLDALSEMYDKMLLMGYKDYQEVCDNFIRVVEKNEKEK